ncbi:MAG: sirohydrochlorin chelatase [Arenicellales bacterium WSBS_2016_MAG_OTU3]
MQDLTSLPEDAGVMICGHGSRAKIAAQEFSLLAAGLRARFPSLKIEYGFLEYASPNIHMGLDSLIAQGVKKIYAVPGMLFRATHAKNDIPSVLTTYMQKHPGLEIRYGRELGLHKQMIKAFEHRVLEALGLDETPKAGELYDTMLVVVGRGTSVATANAEAAKLTRIIAENLGFGWSETVYSGVTFPSVGAGLEMALKLGFKRIVVAPYFLFSGRLIGRIQSYIDKVVNENPNVDFRVADYLRDQTHVIDTFIARIAETVAQESHHHGHENDLMQDFNRRLAAGEVDVHHHHAEFQPHNHADEPHSHADEPHSHSHDHSHGHSHAPYKHIAHPYGPRTMIDENVCCCFMSQFPDEVIALERAKRSARGLAKVEQTPQCQKK